MRLEVGWFRGESEPLRDGVAMLMGDDGPPISRSEGDWANKGNSAESSNTGSNKSESKYKLDCSICSENPPRYRDENRSLSLSGLRGYAAPKLVGVATGVVSLVEDRPRSLSEGEKCRGGGVSRESSFTVVLVEMRVEAV